MLLEYVWLLNRVLHLILDAIIAAHRWDCDFHLIVFKVSNCQLITVIFHKNPGKDNITNLVIIFNSRVLMEQTVARASRTPGRRVKQKSTYLSQFVFQN